MKLRLSAEEVENFIHAEFPQTLVFGGRIVSLEPGRLALRLATTEAHLRPGGTVSGPTLMTLVDTAFYYLVLSLVGTQALAVTTHLSIDFLRRPPPGVLVAEAEMLKLGRRLAVGKVIVRVEDRPEALAHASVTYSLPPSA